MQAPALAALGCAGDRSASVAALGEFPARTVPGLRAGIGCHLQQRRNCRACVQPVLRAESSSEFSSRPNVNSRELLWLPPSETAAAEYEYCRILTLPVKRSE